MVPQNLMVRQYRNQGLWTIERWGRTRRYENADEVLVCQFGSTPIFTRSYQSAMYLAEYCQVNGPPHGLGWIAACPDDKDGAIEFARQRREGEAASVTARRAPTQGPVISGRVDMKSISKIRAEMDVDYIRFIHKYNHSECGYVEVGEKPYRVRLPDGELVGTVDRINDALPLFLA